MAEPEKGPGSGCSHFGLKSCTASGAAGTTRVSPPRPFQDDPEDAPRSGKCLGILIALWERRPSRLRDLEKGLRDMLMG